MVDIAPLFSPLNRARALTAATLLVAIVAAVDWAIKPNFSLNFLYLFPIMLAGDFSPAGGEIAGMGVCCAVLGELFSPFSQADATHAHGYDDHRLHWHGVVCLRISGTSVNWRWNTCSS